MTGHNDTERILDAFLAPEHDQLPDRVVDTALTEIARTPQRRALHVPRRFPLMSQFVRYAVAAVVLVAVAGVGGAFLLTRSDNLGPGAVAPAPTATAAPTPTATAAPTASPAPSEIAPGITGFTPYTSEVYGLTFGVPDGWSQGDKATEKWRDDLPEDAKFQELFFIIDPGQDGVLYEVWQQPAGAGADITTRDGLAAWVRANDPDLDLQGAIPMCVGKTACGPAILLPPKTASTIPAYIADPDAGLVTIVRLGRSDDHPSTARFGGGVQLLKSILTTMDVYEPEPGQIPADS